MNGTGRVAMVMVMAGVPLVKVYHLAGGRVGRSWGSLGRSWGRIEPSGAYLGPLLGNLGGHRPKETGTS